MSRTKLNIDSDQVEELASIGCTVEEIAAVMKCSKSHLDKNHLDIINAGRLRMSASVKRQQYERMMEGNVTAAIWLGKQYCGQRDNFDASVDHTHRYYVEGPAPAEDGKSWQEQYSPTPKSPTMQ